MYSELDGYIVTSKQSRYYFCNKVKAKIITQDCSGSLERLSGSREKINMQLKGYSGNPQTNKETNSRLSHVVAGASERRLYSQAISLHFK